jgi:diaminopimelate epimerase
MSTPVHIEHMHGTGNAFLVVDAKRTSWPSDAAAFARVACDRTTGVVDPSTGVHGADGVLVLTLVGDGVVRMRLVQPDGSTAAMCGNGARVAAAWAAERLGTDHLTVEAPAGRFAAVVDGSEVDIEMNAPRFDPAEIPIRADAPLVDAPVDGQHATAVWTGVPHLVLFVDGVDAVALAQLAPPLRHHPLFPEGTNVTIATQTAPQVFAQRTFERGVEAETQACGTGAVAIAAVATRLGHADATQPVTVRPPGGTLTVLLADAGPAHLIGSVAHTGEQTVDASQLLEVGG